MAWKRVRSCAIAEPRARLHCTGLPPLEKWKQFQMLIAAGAIIDAKDGNGETPLSWASWYGRPTPVLRELLYGRFRIHPQNQSMQANLLGKPLD